MATTGFTDRSKIVLAATGAALLAIIASTSVAAQPRLSTTGTSVGSKSQETARRETQSEQKAKTERQVYTDTKRNFSKASTTVSSPRVTNTFDSPSRTRSGDAQRTQSAGYVTSPWGLTRTNKPVSERPAVEMRIQDSSKRTDERISREVDKRQSLERRDNNTKPVSSPGYVTSPWALPKTNSTADRRDDNLIRSYEEKRRTEAEKRAETERRESPQQRRETSYSRTGSPGYVTSPWAMPGVHTRLEDRYRDHRPPRDYHPPVYNGGRYYYPRHTSYRPYYYGHWVWDDCGISFCRRSVYFYYGVCPYVRVARLYVRPYVVLEYRRVIVYSDDSYYLNRHSNSYLEDAISDIRTAWTSGRIDLLERHVRDDVKIAVLLDREYDYSIDSRDYIDMTRDAMGQMDTQSFFWQSVKQRTDDAYTAYGQHVYTDSLGIRRTVYVSYTLEEISGRYVITEVGSSNRSLSPS